MFFRLTSDPRSSRIEEDAYSVYIDSSRVHMELEKKRYINITWLTTNAMTINENMVGRPSRIRYVKEFGNLDLKVVNEYLDDALQVPEARQDLLDSLTISTIDILKTIVNEVNIHGIEGLRRAKGFFNVVTNEYDYSCICW